MQSRIKQLADEVYWQTFQLLDSQIEYSGDEAGKVATALERAFLAAIEELDNAEVSAAT